MNKLKNSVRLTGYLGSDPETRMYAEDKTLAKVSLATHERFRNNEGEWVTDTQWHSLTFWGKLAEYVEKNLTKGSEISIEGRLVNRSYVDKEEITRYVTEITVHEMLLIQKKAS